MRNQTIFLLAAWTGLFQFAIGQDPGFSKPSPSSPSSEVSTQMVDVPVSHFTGQGAVNIPLHTIQGIEGLSIPIQLQYQASGIRVDQRFSEVGLGWNLMAGGKITREVRGKRDEIKSEQRYEDGEWETYSNIGYLHHYHTSDYFDNSRSYKYHHSEDLTEDRIDTEPDIFHFQVGGYSGSFFFDDTGILKLKSKSDVKVTYSLDNNLNLFPQSLDENVEIKHKEFGAITEFIIETPDGLKYFFNIGDVTVVDGKMESLIEQYPEDDEPNDFPFPYETISIEIVSNLNLVKYFPLPYMPQSLDLSMLGAILQSYYKFKDYRLNNEWKLRRIKNSHDEQLAIFHYTDDQENVILLEEFGATQGRRISTVDNENHEGFLFGDCTSNETGGHFYKVSQNAKITFQKRLFSIYYKTARIPDGFYSNVGFEYETEREDIFDIDFVENQLGGTLSSMLSKITVNNNSSDLIKNFRFIYSKLPIHPDANPGGDLTAYTRKILDAVKVNGDYNGEGELFTPADEMTLFSFDYFDENPLPHYLSYEKDLWGYYNRDFSNPDPYQDKFMLPNLYVYPEDPIMILNNGPSPYSTFNVSGISGSVFHLNDIDGNVRNNINVEAARAGSLKSIENQAGASTELEYELNEFVLPIDLFDRNAGSSNFEVCFQGNGALCSSHDPVKNFTISDPRFSFLDYTHSFEVFENGTLSIGGNQVTDSWSIPGEAKVTLDIYIGDPEKVKTGISQNPPEMVV